MISDDAKTMLSGILGVQITKDRSVREGLPEVRQSGARCRALERRRRYKR